MATTVAKAEALGRRIAALREKLDEQGLDAFIATSKPGYTYLTGFGGEGWKRLVAAAVSRDAVTLVVPAFEAEAAGEHSSSAEILPWSDSEDAQAALAGVIAQSADSPRVGVEENSLNLGLADRLRAEVPGVQLAHAGDALADLRLRKDDAEIDASRRASVLVGEAVGRAFDSAEVGMSEASIKARIELDMKQNGGSETVCLVQISDRAAMPHGESGDRTLQQGDVLLIDAATSLQGYWGDITRCATMGPASVEVLAAWKAVSGGAAAGVAAVGPGVPTRDVDVAARAVIEDAGFGDAFIHRTGHGLGLEVHETPYLSSDSDEVLEPGMIVTVEPGTYFTERFGVRLENDVLVTQSGAEVLTPAPEELREL
jgi:Xaa-Pro dipeptidase